MSKYSLNKMDMFIRILGLEEMQRAYLGKLIEVKKNEFK